MTTKQPHTLKKERLSLPRKYHIPKPSTSLSASEQHEKTVLSKTDDKSVCEKYLNVYESLNQKQSAQINESKQRDNPKIKMIKLKSKVMFENPVIQKSYSKLPDTQNFIIGKNIPYKVQAEPNQQLSIWPDLRKNPNKKNQMALKLITENKKCSTQKQNVPDDEQQEIVVAGINLQHRSSIKFSSPGQSFHNRAYHKDLIECTEHKGDGLAFSFWQHNMFVGSVPVKAYEGYYKAKSKKTNEKKKEKLNRNSTAYIKRFDKSIQIEKSRRSILRPKSIHNNKYILRKQLNITPKVQHLSQIHDFFNQQKIIRTQSQAKLSHKSQETQYQKSAAQQQRTPQKNSSFCGLVRKSLLNPKDKVGFVFNGKLNFEFERKNNKLYNFNNRTSVSRKNYSNHTMCSTYETITPARQTSTEKNCTIQSTTVPSPRTDSPQEQYLNSIQNKFWTKPKKLAQKMVNTNSQLLLQCQGSTYKTAVNGNWQKKSQQITLNKIQDAIDNDTQLRIQRIDTEGVKRGFGDQQMS